MATPWTAIKNDPQERAAFYSLLDDYFTNHVPGSTSSARPPVTQHHRAPSQPQPPRDLPTTVQTTSLNDRFSDLSTSASNSLATSALRNTSTTSSALRNAGLSQGLADAGARFGSKHSERLGPLMAGAARDQLAAGGRAGSTPSGLAPAAAPPPVKGPKPPSGLTSNKSMAGGFSTESKRAFGKSLFASRGPLSNEEAKKNEFKEGLAVKQPVIRSGGGYATGSGGSGGYAPPPVRRAISAEDAGGGEMVEALYDYAGTDETDLPVLEGERLTVVEHVDNDWRKCRNQAGAEGLVPTTYLRSI